MVPLLRLSLAAAITLAVAACASEQPPPSANYAPPAPRQLDAKTQLETGRRY